MQDVWVFFYFCALDFKDGSISVRLETIIQNIKRWFSPLIQKE